MACALYVAAGALALIGCGGSDSGNGSTGTPEATPVEHGATPEGTAAQNAPEAAPAAGKTTLRIAVVPKGLAHQFWLTIKAARKRRRQKAVRRSSGRVRPRKPKSKIRSISFRT